MRGDWAEGRGGRTHLFILPVCTVRGRNCRPSECPHPVGSAPLKLSACPILILSPTPQHQLLHVQHLHWLQPDLPPACFSPGAPYPLPHSLLSSALLLPLIPPLPLGRVRDLLLKYSPAAVILLVGANDVSINASASPEYGTGEAAYVDNMGE